MEAAGPLSALGVQLGAWAADVSGKVRSHPISRVLAQWQQQQRAGREEQLGQHPGTGKAAFATRSMPAPCGPRIVVMPRHAALAAIIPGDSVTEQVLTSGVVNFLNLYNTALICRLVLTWFPNPPEVIVAPLSTIADPYLNLFRGLIPPIGGTLDLSPVLAFIVLNLFTNTAAALPAEVDGPATAPDVGRMIGPYRGSNFVSPLPLSKTEQAWGRRVAVSKAAKAAGGSINPQ